MCRWSLTGDLQRVEFAFGTIQCLNSLSDRGGGVKPRACIERVVAHAMVHAWTWCVAYCLHASVSLSLSKARGRTACRCHLCCKEYTLNDWPCIQVGKMYPLKWLCGQSAALIVDPRHPLGPCSRDCTEPAWQPTVLCATTLPLPPVPLDPSLTFPLYPCVPAVPP
jgi:hypothetical protein